MATIIFDLYNCIVDEVVAHVKVGVFSKLAGAGINHEDINGLDDVFTRIKDPFLDIDTCYKQESYFKKTLGLIVSFFYFNFSYIIFFFHS